MLEEEQAGTRKILYVACGEYGIAQEDIVIDPLAMPVGADTTLVKTTLRTIELIHDELGLNMTLGASNVSFGMPAELVLPAPLDEAADLLLGNDDWGAAWIARSRALAAAAAEKTA